MALFSVQFSAQHYFIFSVYTNLNVNRIFFSTFQIFLQIFNKEYYNLAFLQQFFNTCYLFEEMKPMFVIHNISIATDDDIIQFGNDVNIYTVYLSRAIIIWGNCLNWLEKTIVSDHIIDSPCKFRVIICVSLLYPKLITNKNK